VIRHYQRPQPPIARTESLASARYEPQIVVIAASTGGPAALSEILRGLPANFPLPVVIVQHISPDFQQSLIMWLQMNSAMPVRPAEAGRQPEVGNVYVAPAHAHLKLSTQRCFELAAANLAAPYMPSADILFTSIAAVYQRYAVGIVLTGMGDDGATGLRTLYDQGAATIAQDQATSVVYGMPHEAAVRGGAKFILPLKDIAPFLIRLSR
jgi:two-component system chemotaxis response regulator CheB